MGWIEAKSWNSIHQGWPWCHIPLVLALIGTYLQNNIQTHTPMLKGIQNLYMNKDNGTLKLMTMEFFILPSATQLAHQTPNKDCNVKNKCTFCKSVEVQTSEHVAWHSAELVIVAKLMETNWAYMDAPKFEMWTIDAMLVGCAHFWAFYAVRP